MGDNIVEFRMTAQEAAAVAAWMNLRRQGPQGMMDDMNRLNQRTGRFGAQSQSMFARMGMDFRHAALAMAGIATPMMAIFTFAQKVRQEAEAIRRMQEKSKEEQVTLGQAMDQLIQQKLPTNARLNVGGKAITDKGDIGHAILAMIDAQTERTISRTQAAQLVGESISAQSNDDITVAVKNAVAVMGLASEQTAEVQKQMVKAVAIIQEEPAFASEKLSAGDIVAKFNESVTKGPSASEDLDNLLRNILPAISGLGRNGGITLDEALAFTTTIQKTAQDPTGQVSSTAAINMMRDVAVTAMEFGIGQIGAKEADGTSFTLTEALKGIQQNGRAQERLVGIFSANMQAKFRDEGITDEEGFKRLGLKGKQLRGTSHQRARTYLQIAGFFGDPDSQTETGTARLFRDNILPSIKAANAESAQRKKDEAAELSAVRTYRASKKSEISGELFRTGDRNTAAAQYYELLKKAPEHGENAFAAGFTAFRSQMGDLLTTDKTAAQFRRLSENLLAERVNRILASEGISGEARILGKFMVAGGDRGTRAISREEFEKEAREARDAAVSLSPETNNKIDSLLDQIGLLIDEGIAREQEPGKNRKTPAEASRD